MKNRQSNGFGLLLAVSLPPAPWGHNTAIRKRTWNNKHNCFDSITAITSENTSVERSWFPSSPFPRSTTVENRNWTKLLSSYPNVKKYLCCHYQSSSITQADYFIDNLLSTGFYKQIMNADLARLYKFNTTLLIRSSLDFSHRYTDILLFA